MLTTYREARILLTAAGLICWTSSPSIARRMLSRCAMRAFLATLFCTTASASPVMYIRCSRIALSGHGGADVTSSFKYAAFYLFSLRLSGPKCLSQFSLNYLSAWSQISHRVAPKCWSQASPGLVSVPPCLAFWGYQLLCWKNHVYWNFSSA